MHVGLALLPAALVLVLYWSDLHLGFFSIDDPDYVQNNPLIRSLSPAAVGRVLVTPYFANFAPVHLLSYSIDYAIGGLQPLVYHVSNNLWAAAGAALVYLTAFALLRSRALAALSAILFVVHPAHVEAVAWISSRKDLVATPLGLVALLCYWRYRESGPRHWLWYGGSLAAYTLAVAAKQSVICLPVVFALWDFLVAKRSLMRLWADKLPYVAVSVLVALPALGTQPQTLQHPSIGVIAYAFCQNLWLLTGLGEYVIYRDVPQLTAWQKMAYPALVAVLAVTPLLWRRRLPPLALFLWYWILLAFVPTQVLSFVHPVSDRYLYFPSIPAMMLMAMPAGLWLRARVPAKRWAAWAGALAVTGILLWQTQAYLAEWRHPRSVWYPAQHKSDDKFVHFYLGVHYQDAADRLKDLLRRRQPVPPDLRALAQDYWAEDARLPDLLKEWAEPSRLGPRSDELLKALAHDAAGCFHRAAERNQTRILPHLFFRQAKLLLEDGKPAEARAAFQRALSEAERHPFLDTRQSLSVYCHHALAVIAWQGRNYPEALRLLKLAEAEQARAPRIWLPNLSQDRKRLEAIMAAQAGASAGAKPGPLETKPAPPAGPPNAR